MLRQPVLATGCKASLKIKQSLIFTKKTRKACFLAKFGFYLKKLSSGKL